MEERLATERLDGWSEVFIACGMQQSIEWLKLRSCEVHKSCLKKYFIRIETAQFKDFLYVSFLIPHNIEPVKWHLIYARVHFKFSLFQICLNTKWEIESINSHLLQFFVPFVAVECTPAMEMTSWKHDLIGFWCQFSKFKQSISKRTIFLTSDIR